MAALQGTMPTPADVDVIVEFTLLYVCFCVFYALLAEQWTLPPVSPGKVRTLVDNIENRWEWHRTCIFCAGALVFAWLYVDILLRAGARWAT